jgi:hypothetical protein
MWYRKAALPLLLFMSPSSLRLGFLGFRQCLFRLLHLIPRSIKLFAHSKLLLQSLDSNGDLLSKGCEYSLGLFDSGLLGYFVSLYPKPGE